MTILHYDNVFKSFDAPVLSGVNLSVQRGERLAIVGPSGTGKSVLLKLANGLILPDRGDVYLDGQSVGRASRKELTQLRKRVGYVFQNAALFDSMTIFENVTQGIADEEFAQLSSDVIEERVCAALEQVNLDAAALHYKLPSELSGGMRKRVGLARALIGKPELLLYDEPVTGLDPVTAAAVSYLITETAKDVTTVLVTHDVEGALDLVDRIALLAQGALVFMGTPEDFRQSQQPLVRAFAHRDAAKTAAKAMERQ